LYWFVNDRYLGESRPGVPAFWPLQRGTFQIVCSDTRGVSDRVQIAVE
jgi:membrane carboxypeptidase/penicillin-binding protein PbpC